MFTEMLAFLRALYDGVPEGYLTLTAIHPDRNHSTPSRHIPLHSDRALADALEHLLAANAQGWGAYFGVAPRRANLGRWRRGNKGDLTALPALFVDIDGDPDVTLPKLRGFTPAPSCIVHSGGGLHGHWLIRPTTDWQGAERTLRSLARHFNGDTMNISTSLRLPGTRNTKPERNGALCYIIDFHPERRYTLADFPSLEAAVPAHSPRQSAYTPSPTFKGSLNPNLVQAILDCLFSEFCGYVKANGYVAALCPCGHCRDFPGSHFNFDTAKSVGVCFGRHGRLLLKDLCTALKLRPADYGGIYASR